MQKGTYESKFKRDGIEVPIHCILMNVKQHNNPIKFHYHEYIEILYSLDSDADVYVNDNCYRFRKGDLLIINSGENHDLNFKRADASYIVIKVLPEILYSSDQSVFEMKYLRPFVIESSRNKRFFTASQIGDHFVHDTITRIMHEWSNAAYGYEMAMRADILKLFLWVLRYWQNKNLEPIAAFDYPDEILTIIQSALEYISQNYAYVTAASVAEHCNLSYCYFSRTFKSVMNQSFTKYLTDFRITKAEQLLCTTNKSITEISELVGFSTPSYFIQQFRLKKGISPKHFRMNTVPRAKSTQI